MHWFQSRSSHSGLWCVFRISHWRIGYRNYCPTLHQSYGPTAISAHTNQSESLHWFFLGPFSSEMATKVGSLCVVWRQNFPTWPVRRDHASNYLWTYARQQDHTRIPQAHHMAKSHIFPIQTYRYGTLVYHLHVRSFSKHFPRKRQNIQDN